MLWSLKILINASSNLHFFITILSLQRMRTITINIPPLGTGGGANQPSGLENGSSPWEYIIATRSGGAYQYQHQVMLSHGGSVLQVLSQALDGSITQALEQNAFDLAQGPLVATLIDVNGDGTEFKLRLENESLSNPLSAIVLPPGTNRQLRISEVSYTQGNGVIETLGFIGADDIRMGFSAQFMRVTGESFEINYNTNSQDLTLKYT